MSNSESTLKVQPVVFASSLDWLIDSSSQEEVKSDFGLNNWNNEIRFYREI